jgi:all-trans-8'-apo-beta-carotenal 15,15'-oxygenase
VCTALQHNFGFNGGAVVALYRATSHPLHHHSHIPITSTLRIHNAMVEEPSFHHDRIRKLSPSERKILSESGASLGWSTLQHDIHLSFSSPHHQIPLEGKPQRGGRGGIRGILPADLKGTFLRNGPGSMEVFGTPLSHPIDGDGVVVAISFNGKGDAEVHSAFVNTRTRKAEREAQKMLHKGQMGSRLPDGNTHARWRDTAHTNVLHWGDRLLAFHEYALPYRLDPHTLQTIGVEDFGGRLMRKEDGSRGSLCAHFRYDPTTKFSVFVSFSPMRMRPNGDILQSSVTFYEVDSDYKVKHETTVSVKGLNYVHDLLLTPSFYVVHMSPFVSVSQTAAMAVLSGESAPGELMKFYPGLPCRLVCVRRPSHDPTLKSLLEGYPSIFEFDLPQPVHIYHFSRAVEYCLPHNNNIPSSDVIIPPSAFSDTDTPNPEATPSSCVRTVAIEVEACVLPRGFTMEFQDKLFLSNSSEAPGVMSRILCRFGSRAASLHQIDRASCEFPVIHPGYHLSLQLLSASPHSVLADNAETAPGVPCSIQNLSDFPSLFPRFTYLMANDRGEGQPFCDIVKMDALSPHNRSVWSPEDSVVGEPCYVPKPDAKSEDDGYLIVQVFRLSSHTTEFAVLDAKKIQSGPVAVVDTGVLLPYGFHGTYSHEICGVGSKPSAKL